MLWLLDGVATIPASSADKLGRIEKFGYEVREKSTAPMTTKRKMNLSVLLLIENF